MRGRGVDRETFMRKISVAGCVSLVVLIGSVWIAQSQENPKPAKLQTIKIKDDLY